jgi:2-dehydro-3-deoxyphosphooctonate aldolase (KDO 8-P synthase)
MNLAGFEVGLDRPLFVIAGPCVIEGEQFCIDVAGRLRELTAARCSPRCASRSGCRC